MNESRPTYQTKSAYAAHMLRQAFAEGRYIAGDRLQTARLAEELGLSLTPVREALFELASEGLVNLSPHRGARVADVHMASLTEVYLLRELLESTVTRFAAANATQDGLQRLAECHDRFTDAVESGHRDELRQLSDEFHIQIYDMAQLPLFRRLIRVVWVAAPEDTFKVIEERPQRSVSCHEEILAALQEGNSYAAESSMKAHIRESLNLIQEVKESSGRPSTEQSVSDRET